MRSDQLKSSPKNIIPNWVLRSKDRALLDVNKLTLGENAGVINEESQTSGFDESQLKSFNDGIGSKPRSNSDSTESNSYCDMSQPKSNSNGDEVRSNGDRCKNPKVWRTSVMGTLKVVPDDDDDEPNLIHIKKYDES